MYLCLPVTIARAFTLGRLVPATCQLAAGVVRPSWAMVLTQSTSGGKLSEARGFSGRLISDAGIRDAERRTIHAPLLSGGVNHHFASRCSHFAKLGRHGWRSTASEGAHVPGRERSIRHHEPHGIGRNAQFVGNGLGERGSNILPDLSLAGECRDASIGRDVQPSGDVLREIFAGWAMLCATRLLGEAVDVQSQKDEKSAAERFQKAAAVREGVFASWLSVRLASIQAWRRSFASAAIRREAIWTAETILL